MSFFFFLELTDFIQVYIMSPKCRSYSIHNWAYTIRDDEFQATTIKRNT